MTRRLAYEDLGAGPGAVMLVHGQPGAAADWHGVAHALRDRFRVVVPDRPGYGATGGAPCGIRGNARVLLDLVERLGLGAVTVVGHSWGTAVALAMASDPRVKGIVLVAPVSPVDGQVGPADRALADRRVGPHVARVVFGLAGAAIALPPTRLLLSAALPGRDGRAWGATARSLFSAEVANAFWYEQCMLLEELPLLAGDVRPLGIPSAVVVGRHDVVTPPAVGRDLGRALGARIVEVARAGHMLPQRMPDVVARAVSHTAGQVEP